jgi:hypothetical protein
MRGFHRNRAGIELAFVSTVRVLRSVVRVVLITVPVVTCAARIHAHVVDTPDAMQELNRCLRLVTVAASRRETPKTITAQNATPLASKRPGA